MKDEKTTEEKSTEAAASSRPMHLQKAVTHTLEQSDGAAFPGEIVKIAEHRFDALVMAILAEANGNNIAGWETFEKGEAESALENRGYRRAEPGEEEDTPGEDIPTEPPDDQVNPAEALINGYRDILHLCFDASAAVMEMAELVEISVDDRASYDRAQQTHSEIRTRIALDIFGKCTRESPGQAKVFELALQYLSTMLKAQEEDRKRGEELRESAPFMPASPPFGMFGGGMGAAVCDHPGLRALYDYLTGEEFNGDVNTAIEDVVKCLTLPKPTPEGDDFLMCPHCRALVPIDKFKEGVLWSEEAEAQRKAARDAEFPPGYLTPLEAFNKAVEKASEAGGVTATLLRHISARIAPTGVAHDSKIDDVDIADLVGDPDFFETVRGKYGEGVYIVKLWKADLELHSEHRFLIA